MQMLGFRDFEKVANVSRKVVATHGLQLTVRFHGEIAGQPCHPIKRLTLGQLRWNQAIRNISELANRAFC